MLDTLCSLSATDELYIRPCKLAMMTKKPLQSFSWKFRSLTPSAWDCYSLLPSVIVIIWVTNGQGKSQTFPSEFVGRVLILASSSVRMFSIKRERTPRDWGVGLVRLRIWNIRVWLNRMILRVGTRPESLGLESFQPQFSIYIFACVAPSLLHSPPFMALANKSFFLPPSLSNASKLAALLKGEGATVRESLPEDNDTVCILDSFEQSVRFLSSLSFLALSSSWLHSISLL